MYNEQDWNLITEVIKVDKLSVKIARVQYSTVLHMDVIHTVVSSPDRVSLFRQPIRSVARRPEGTANTVLLLSAV